MIKWLESSGALPPNPYLEQKRKDIKMKDKNNNAIVVQKDVTICAPLVGTLISKVGKNKLDCFASARNDMDNIKNLVPECPSALMPLKKVAFTLAEVLITLGIIGVVAAMTIPTLLTEHAKQRTVTQLKHAYSDISQALKLAEAEYGSPEGWLENPSDTFGAASSDFIENYLAPNIKMALKCPTDNSPCWAIGEYTTLAGEKAQNANATVAQYQSFVTLSGYAVLFWVGGGTTYSDYTRHYQFIVDVNGKKGPNVIGKDAFQFTYVQNPNGGWFLMPANYYGDDYSFKDKGGVIQRYTRNELLSDSKYGCSKNVKGEGGSLLCTSLIFEDGWKIAKDYPW